MAILSTLLAVSEPSGFWVSIIKAFESGVQNYVLAIILLTIIIRIIWAPIDTLNRRMSFKMSVQQAKLKPELDIINKKYANDPKMLKQKQNELYQKNNTKSMGSCAFMFIFLALNLVVFFTLFSGLNSMASYKISDTYENLKYDYANTLVLTDEYTNGLKNIEEFKDYENLYFERYTSEDGKEMIGLFNKTTNEKVAEREYEKDFSYKKNQVNEETGENEEVTVSTNEHLTEILNRFYPENEEENGVVVLETETTDEEGNVKTEKIFFGQTFKLPAMNFISISYNKTKENFLWIDNIWMADSPFEKSVFTYKTFVSRVGEKNVEAGEEKIYNSFMSELRNSQARVNGYLILPLLCVISSFLSIWLSSRKKKGEEIPQQANGKFMKFIMPCIFGIFALFYNSVFAIYMFVSQLISALLIPLQNLIINKWSQHDEKKEEKNKKVVEVDYSRKF